MVLDRSILNALRSSFTTAKSLTVGTKNMGNTLAIAARLHGTTSCDEAV
jgi:hypothetical protein